MATKQKTLKLLQKIEEEEQFTESYLSGREGPFSLRRMMGREYRLDWLDFVTVITGVSFILVAIFSVISSIWLPALFFGIALLITTAIQQWEIQIAVLGFTTLYWILTLIFGAIIDAIDISLFIFGVNTISLGVFLVGSIAVASAGALGFIGGTIQSRRWAGIIIVLLSFFLALVDFFVAVYVLATPLFDALRIVGVNMAVYGISLLTTWGIFYFIAAFFRRVKEEYAKVVKE